MNGFRPALRSAALVSIVALLVGLPVFAQGLRLGGLGGQELRESDFAQGTTIVVVWTTWAPQCRDIDRRVAALSDRWGRQARLATVAFQEDAAAVEKFLAGKRFPAPVFLDEDGEFSKKYGVTTVPGLLVIQNGRTAYRGRLPDDPDAVIDPLLE